MSNFDFDFSRVGMFRLVDPDGNEISQHTTIAYAQEAGLRHALDNEVNGEYSILPPHWSLTTMGFGINPVQPPDAIPNPFVFPAKVNQSPSTVVVSASVDLLGFNQPASISVSGGGEYSIDGAAFTAVAGTVTVGQSVRVRHTTGPNQDDVVATTLTVGGVAGIFQTTTTVVAVSQSIPADLFIEIGTPYDLGQYITDANGIVTGTEVINLSTFASYDSFNRELNGITAGYESGLVLRVTYPDDVIDSNVFAVNVTQASEATATNFPHTGLYSQGYWNPTSIDSKGGLNVRLGLMAKYKYCIFGNVRAWSYNGIDGGPYYVRDLPTMTKALSTVDTKCFMYVKSVEVSRASTADQYEKIRAKCASEVGPNGDWYLRSYRDCHVSSFPTKMEDCAEVASTWRINHSELTTPDSRGLRVPEWTARLDHYDERYGDDPGDWASNGDGIHSEDGWEGVFIDVMSAQGKVGADWDGDGVTEDKEGQQVVDWVTIGHVNHVNAWRALEPSFIICGNFAGNASQLDNYNLVPPRFYDLLEGPNSEFMAGTSAAHEYWAANENEMMLYMKRIMSFNTISRAAGTQTYELIDCKATAGYIGSHTLVSWTRYMLCFTLQDDGFLSMTDFIDKVGFPLVCNEFDLDMGQALEPPNYDGSASGYASYQNGVYKREFFNSSTGVGYIAYWNPKNNGTQIVTHPIYAGYQWNHLGAADFPDPVEDSSINSGAENVTQLSIPSQSGHILKRVAV